MSGEHAWICGVGLVTSVGGCTSQTVSSVRAGINAYKDHAVQTKRFVPMTMALVPNEILPPVIEELRQGAKLTPRQVRMLRLAQLAMTEALEPVFESYESPVPLVLAGPETIPGCHSSMGVGFLSFLQIQAQIQLDVESSTLITIGRAGGMQALQYALYLLVNGDKDYVLLGGVDSYLDLHLLATLDRDDRILAPGVMDGFAPGEGAGFLLLCSDRVRESMPNPPMTRLLHPGVADETGHRFSEEPYRGDGLAEAMAGALQPLDDGVIEAVYTSMNGENLHAKEWGVAYTRNSARIDPEFRFEHPADCYGDLGAASMPVLCGLASSAIERGHVTRAALVICSSDGASRGAVCLTRG